MNESKNQRQPDENIVRSVLMILTALVCYSALLVYGTKD